MLYRIRSGEKLKLYFSWACGYPNISDQAGLDLKRANSCEEERLKLVEEYRDKMTSRLWLDLKAHLKERLKLVENLADRQLDIEDAIEFIGRAQELKYVISLIEEDQSQ